VHVLVPGAWTVQRGHELLERVEEAIRDALPECTVFTHLEPLEDPVSFLPDPPGHAAAAIDNIRAVQARHWEVLR